MMHYVKFTKLFVNGLLEGLTYEDKLSFPSDIEAAIFVESIYKKVIKSCVGTSDYVMISATIEHDVEIS